MVTPLKTAHGQQCSDCGIGDGEAPARTGFQPVIVPRLADRRCEASAPLFRAACRPNETTKSLVTLKTWTVGPAAGEVHDERVDRQRLHGQSPV